MLSNYFKERKGFQRVLNLLKEKYISLGRFAGTVTLQNITEEEAESFTDFFGKRFSKGETIQIRFRDIERALVNTMYENFSWEEVFTSYFEEEIITQKFKKEIDQKEYDSFYEEVQEKLSEKEKAFLKKVRNEKQIERILKKRYKKEQSFKDTLSWLIKLVFQVEEKTPTTLAMFASITKNPHFLDLKTSNMTLFLKFLSHKLEIEEPKTTEEKIIFLQNIGIGIDSVSNFVITYKLKSTSKLVNIFLEEKEILNLNLSNLNKIKDIDTQEKKVFVFENPSLITELKSLDVPIIITSGNANLCVIEVLKMLEKSKNEIYYNGDFDPEGLLNAENLKKKIPSLKYFCYEKEDYENTKSKEMLNSSRIKKINALQEEDLKIIKELLVKNKLAGYQEKNKERIKEFIESKIL